MTETSNNPVNLDNLMNTAMGDDAFVKEIVQMFVVIGAQQITSLKNLVKDGEIHDWVELSHSLKGTAAGVGAMDMRELCAQSQKMLVATRQDREEVLDKIAASYELAKQYLIDQSLYETNA